MNRQRRAASMRSRTIASREGGSLKPSAPAWRRNRTLKPSGASKSLSPWSEDEFGAAAIATTACCSRGIRTSTQLTARNGGVSRLPGSLLGSAAASARLVNCSSGGAQEVSSNSAKNIMGRRCTVLLFEPQSVQRQRMIIPLRIHDRLFPIVRFSTSLRGSAI